MHENNDFDYSYAPVARNLIFEVVDGRLNTKEMYLLLWLTLKANFRTGIVRIGYGSLAEELDCSVNAATKLVLSLKRKGFFEFKQRQGKRGLFRVKVTHYLVPERLAEIKELAASRSKAEVKHDKQKSDEDYVNGELPISPRGESLSRTSNTNTDKEKNKEYFNRTHHEGENPFGDSERARCEAIAKAIGDESPAFVISAWKKYGAEIVEDAYAQTVKRCRQIEVDNPGALFNTIVRVSGEP